MVDKDYRLNRLSLDLAYAIENLPNGVFHVSGGKSNVDDLKSLVLIHNRITWTAVYSCLSIHSSGILYAFGIDVGGCAGFTCFDP